MREKYNINELTNKLLLEGYSINDHPDEICDFLCEEGVEWDDWENVLIQMREYYIYHIMKIGE